MCLRNHDTEILKHVQFRKCLRHMKTDTREYSLTHRKASNSWPVLSSWLSARSPMGIKQDGQERCCSILQFRHESTTRMGMYNTEDVTYVR